MKFASLPNTRLLLEAPMENKLGVGCVVGGFHKPKDEAFCNQSRRCSSCFLEMHRCLGAQSHPNTQGQAMGHTEKDANWHLLEGLLRELPAAFLKIPWPELCILALLMESWKTGVFEL